MFLSRHETAHRPVRVKRRNLPRIHILLASPQCLLHQRTQPFTTPFCFPAFSTYSSIHARPSFPSIVGIAHFPFSFRRHSNPFSRRPDFPASLAAPYNKD